jgi:hypothetical protein
MSVYNLYQKPYKKRHHISKLDKKLDIEFGLC